MAEDWTAGIPACNAVASAASNAHIVDPPALFRASHSCRQDACAPVRGLFVLRTRAGKDASAPGWRMPAFVVMR